MRRRGARAVLLLAGALACCVLAGLAVGSQPVALPDVWSALTAPTGSPADVVVRELRVPRTLLGLAVGAALGMAGVLAQGHTRNPMADPGLLGVGAGASCAVVLAIQLLGVRSPAGYLWFAFAGALLAAAAVAALAQAVRSASPVLALVLCGAVVTAFLSAVTSALVLADATTLDAFRFWSVGSLAGRRTEVLLPVLPAIAAGAVLALANAPGLNALALGEDAARALGQRVWLTRATGLAAITLLTGAATAACGTVGFVGLVVPHLARDLVGADVRWQVPVAGLAGGVLLLAADVVGRVAVRPGELQVGIVLALLGAPFFVAVARRRRLVAA
ncbi:iron ABC transporter permease [Kineococcus glutinatus]|uniref:Iron chelate uptake ABC transporter family permease subunit n=1 Tax=Kineococcus glutinatus TaxID=1070872 RepID=A0ABP8VDC7_9ACTN